MSAGTIVWIVIVLLIVCCLFIHRRVISALVKHEPMPKAPKWHFWIAGKNRRG